MWEPPWLDYNNLELRTDHKHSYSEKDGLIWERLRGTPKLQKARALFIKRNYEVGPTLILINLSLSVKYIWHLSVVSLMLTYNVERPLETVR